MQYILYNVLHGQYAISKTGPIFTVYHIASDVKNKNIKPSATKIKIWQYIDVVITQEVPDEDILK